MVSVTQLSVVNSNFIHLELVLLAEEIGTGFAFALGLTQFSKAVPGDSSPLSLSPVCGPCK